MVDLQHATVVLTGASSGIGAAAATLLDGRVGRLIRHGLGSDENMIAGDFRRLESVAETARAISQRTDRVDVLINNAGIPGPPRRTVIADGHEVTLQVNLLAGALLADRLLPLLPSGGRIVNVASATHYSATLDGDLELTGGEYSAVRAYAQSKLAIVTYSTWLARELGPAGVDVVSVHPGVISTGLLHAMFGAGGAPVDRAAAVLVDLAGRPLTTGAYYDEHEVAAPNPVALGPATQERVARYVREAIGA